MAEGYIALYRILLDKPIWQRSTPEQKTILVTLLLMANHEENEWEWMGQKFKVFPGQFVTSLDSIVKAAGKGITIQNVRSALERFQKLDFLTEGVTKCGRLVTILKWHTYQVELKKGNKDTNKEVTKTQQRGNKEVTPNNNDKNDKNDNKDIYTPEFEKFYGIYPRPQAKQDTFNNWNKLLKSNITIDHIMQCTQNYINYLNEYTESDRPYAYGSNNFLGTKSYYKDFERPKKAEARKTQAKKADNMANFEQRDNSDIDDKFFTNVRRVK